MNQKGNLKRNIILGLVIGDGYISNTKNCNSLVIRHSLKQECYIDYKIKLLESIYPNRKINKIYIQNGIQIAIGDSKLLRIYRKWLYPNNKKDITKVLHFLTPQSIALWYMDDGSLSKKKKNGVIHSYELTLNTYINKEENQKIINFFKKQYNIQFTQTKGKGKYRLRMGKIEATKFFKIIEPYIIDCMKYKITFS